MMGCSFASAWAQADWKIRSYVKKLFEKSCINYDFPERSHRCTTYASTEKSNENVGRSDIPVQREKSNGSGQ